MDELLPGLVFVFGVGVICGVLLGQCDGKNKMRNRAIEAGVAEWRVDSKTGETEFVWVK